MTHPTAPESICRYCDHKIRLTACQRWIAVDQVDIRPDAVVCPSSPNQSIGMRHHLPIRTSAA